jgi:histidinol-phosphate aminotransferase
MTPIRPDLDTLPAYVPGRAIPGAIKLASNEVALAPTAPVLAAIAEAAAAGNRYPDLAVVSLSERLASELDVTPDRIAVGCGSVSLCQQLVQITCRETTDEVVYAWRSFEAYPIVTQIGNARAVTVPLDGDFRHDLDAMAAAVTPRTRLVFVCSPNNPTGTAVGAAELEELLARVPRDVLVVVDEAYAEFVRDPTAADGLAAHRAHPNVAVLRTFSKAHGLAGLRVGYAVAHEPVAEALRKAMVPFGVSALAQLAAVASLAAGDELTDRVDAIVAERERVAAALAEQGWRLPRSEANFVWLPVGSSTPDLVEACARAGLSVRGYGADGVRATVGDEAADDLLIEVCGEFLRTWSPDRVG